MENTNLAPAFSTYESYKWVSLSKTVKDGILHCKVTQDFSSSSTPGCISGSITVTPSV